MIVFHGGIQAFLEVHFPGDARQTVPCQGKALE